MILTDIKRYLQERTQATLTDMCVHFDSDPDAMRAMLTRWMEKGKVIKMVQPNGCKRGCASCGCNTNTEIYAWRT